MAEGNISFDTITKKVRKNFPSITIGSGGWAETTPPDTPTGYTFLMAVIGNVASTTGCVTMLQNGRGQYVIGNPGTTITNLEVDYIFIQSKYV